MQIVVDVPDKFIENLFDGKETFLEVYDLLRRIANSTTLPKGHGRLIDADSFLEKYDVCGYIEDIKVDYFNAVTPTIIEADKE